MPHNLTQPVLDWLASRQHAMVALLGELVDIDSNSHDRAGVIRVFDRIDAFLQDAGIATQRHMHNGQQVAMSAHVPGPENAKHRPVLLTGHCDTVFPTGEVARRPFRIDGNLAYGPGVADMKAGLAMNAFILAAYAATGAAPVPLIGLFTCDEEIGSPESKEIIETFARDAAFAFNAEPGRANGDVVTGRRGGVFLEMGITGKAAHSGGNFAEGISAISELAHKTLALDALTDLQTGVTVNVGLVSGGQSINTTAPWARGGIDLRINTLDQRDAMVDRIQRIVDTSNIPGTQASLKIIGEFRPMVKTDESSLLYQRYRQALQSLGYDAGEQFSGGCADSGITSSLGCVTLCATGPVGGKPHTPDEYVELHTFTPRAQAIVLTIAALSGA